MSDDGLLLNFAAENSSSRSKGQVRRGHLKSGQRATASKHHSQPAPESAAGPLEAASSSLTVYPPTRGGQKVSSAGVARYTASSQKDSERVKRGTPVEASSSATAEQHKSKSGERTKGTRGTAVISSLFAGDDGLKDEERVTEAKTSQNAPTNAPSTVFDFNRLQLNPLLVAHLASDKMNNITRPTGIQRTALPFLLSPSAHKQDALLHAQTGSGKTLCYLLPIIQSLLPFCEASWIDRSCLGTLAVILAPTRELARQIYEVAEAICSLHLAPASATRGSTEDVEQGEAVRRTRWIVPGLLSGGATKNHEKSRLRKGLPLIVATPGRLLDHLRNTAALDVGRLQWLVLDEADRLLQLGFEETLNDILKAVEARRRAACEMQRERMRNELGNQYGGQTIDEADVIDTFGESWWKHARHTVLCSATLDEGVQVLAGKSLREPKVIRSDAEREEATHTDGAGPTDDAFLNTPVAAPAQLSQNYVVVPTKQRMVLLIALIRRAIAEQKTAKIMVFLSCTDSVDFHLAALAGVTMTRGLVQEPVTDSKPMLTHTSELLPTASLFKLHGSMTAHDRQASLKAFAQCKDRAAILFCTSVASRGLDLHVSHVVQVDAPTEKGADEYMHRIGRTARAGKAGESWLMLLSSEEGCVEHYGAAVDKVNGTTKRVVAQLSVLHRREPTSVLRDGFGGVDLLQTQTRATDAQMALERWAVASEQNARLARRAYLSHLRAYATHPPSERALFAIANLQLGHLAKAFALREAPGEIRAKSLQDQQATAKRLAAEANAGIAEQQTRKRKRAVEGATFASDNDGSKSSDDDDDHHHRRQNDDVLPSKLTFQRNKETESRMYAKVREMGKLHKRAGIFAEHGGADEFQIG